MIYNKTFSLVSTKKSLRLIMTLVAYFDLELHQADVKMVFLNGDLEEEVYIQQPLSFSIDDSNNLVCKLKKLIYELKQVFRQWYKKFNQVILNFGFPENIIDQCIYFKASESKFIILVLYVDGIFLETNDLGLLHETKEFLSSHFNIKNKGDVAYVFGIKIRHNRIKGVLSLSQKFYILKVLKRYEIQNCSFSSTPIVKRDKLSLKDYPRDDNKKS